MSFMNGFERDRIYAEMDEASGKSKGGIFSKLLSIVLLVSVGFASGSIYSTFHNASLTTLTPANGTSTILPTPAPSGNNFNVLPATSLSDVVENIADSVVEITQYTATQSVYYSNTGFAEGNGSGVIISEDGYILTNNHVIAGANKIKVRLRNGTEYEATLVGKDAKTDMAIIKVEATGLQPACFSNSASTRVGDFVMAIGNPLGELGGTVTYGFVSALEREISIDNSDASRFKIIDGVLIPPFRTIDGLGDTVAKAIVEEREKRYFLSIEDLQKRAKVSQTLIDKLKEMHILDHLPDSSQLSLF